MRGTIRSTDEISALFEAARKIQTNSFIALIQTQDGKRGTKGRVAYIAGRKLGSAPTRNRIKRRLREAAHQCHAPWEGFDVVLVAKKKAASASFISMVEDMTRVQEELIRDAVR
ncbi:MAG: ribonuclease P protein component [Coriobacteriia bacterium]|nr:ribonuclease P protein component [Coriobacteriia bacterium]